MLSGHRVAQVRLVEMDVPYITGFSNRQGSKKSKCMSIHRFQMLPPLIIVMQHITGH